MLSGRGLCDGLITLPEESYRLWCVVVCDLETSLMRGAMAHWAGGGGGGVTQKTNKKALINWTTLTYDHSSSSNIKVRYT